MAYEQNLVVFEALKYEQPWTLASYRKFGGYEAWEKILREKTPPEKIIADCNAFVSETEGVVFNVMPSIHIPFTLSTRPLRSCTRYSPLSTFTLLYVWS